MKNILNVTIQIFIKDKRDSLNQRNNILKQNKRVLLDE